MTDLLSSAWLWLFVIVTVAMGIMLIVFKIQDHLKEIRDYKAGIEAYKWRVSDEFNKRMAEESRLYDRCNQLGWRIDELKDELANIKKQSLMQEVN